MTRERSALRLLALASASLTSLACALGACSSSTTGPPAVAPDAAAAEDAAEDAPAAADDGGDAADGGPAAFGEPCTVGDDTTCIAGLFCLAGPLGGDVGFCTKTCAKTSAAACAGTPSGTAAFCVVTGVNSGGDKGCAFVCRQGSATYRCPGKLECQTTQEPAGSGQYLCLP
jgi:hypothetical protein